MNNQIYNIPNDWFNFKGELSNNNNNLETPIIGFQKGNMFKNLYEPYKNYRPQRIKINKETNFLMIQMFYLVGKC